MRSPRARRLLAAAAVAAGVSGATLASLVACGERPATEVGDGSSTGPEAVGSGLADAEPPAFTVPAPVPLQASRFDSTWATVRLATAVRAAPRGEARVVARLALRTPEETTNLVLTLDRAKDAQGSLWIRVRFPGFPDNTTGWVPRSTLGGGGVVGTRLVVDLGDRRATLPPRPGGLPQRRRDRYSGRADADRRLLHPQQADSLSKRLLRPRRLRHERGRRP